MKKRLLITSIVMMLVVAVALSTATYAWFTSSATVTSSAISLTASTNDAASLGISWTNGNYGTTITAAGPQSGSSFKPACPNELAEGTTTIGATVATTHNIEFFTAYATPSEGDMVFSGTPTAASVYTWTDDTTPANAATAHNSFFIKNLSPANSINSVTVKATITDTNNLVRVAIFKKVADGYKLLGVLAKQEADTYTAVAADTVLTHDAQNPYYVKRLGKYVLATYGDAAAYNNGTVDYISGETEAEANQFFTKAEGTATNATAVYGTISNGESVNAMDTMVTTNATVGIDITEGAHLAADAVIELKVLVWEDAIALGDAEASNTETTVTTSVALSFIAG